MLDRLFEWRGCGALQRFLNRRVSYEGFSRKDLDTFVRERLERPHPQKLQLIKWLTAADLPEKFSLLDVGCGPGVFARLLQQSPLASRVQYTGLDVNAEALDYCRKMLPRCRFIEGDVTAGALPSDHFDVIVLHEMLEHAAPTYRNILAALAAKRPRILAVSTFAVLPELTKDQIRWNAEHKCYMNSYAFTDFYAFLRGQVKGPIEMVDFGSREYASRWFKRKADLAFCCQIGPD